MTTLNFCKRAILACGLILSMLPAAHAQGLSKDIGYSEMCVKAADMPKPYGEWDLKGNAKLKRYCGCFAPLFEARAMKAAKFMEANPGKVPPGTLEQSSKEELDMRNSCRKKLGLPLAVEPKS